MPRFWPLGTGSRKASLQIWLSSPEGRSWEPLAQAPHAGQDARRIQTVPFLRDPLQVLSEVFGHAAFRGQQEGVVRHVVGGGDAVVLLPTGAGKSLCYQVPSLVRPGTGIVISPLIALMRDQVEALRQAGVRAYAWNSSLVDEERSEARRAILAGEADLVYVAPEGVVQGSFNAMIGRFPVSLVAIDEAHCVSSWGHDFRPEYTQLRLLKDLLPGVPRIALTATADPQTQADLRVQLDMEDAAVFQSSFDRPNISYTIAEKTNPKRQLLSFVKGRAGQSGIVYCLSRAKVDETAAYLKEQGVKALPYHAGLPREERDANQDAFLREEGLVLVGTIAFGMGIDKPDVRFVFHNDLPSSVEAYYQETGRAGRDGLPSEAYMVYGMADMVRRRKMIDEGNAPDQQKAVERRKLSALLGIAETAGCRRQALLAHFGEAHPGGCGNCDTCLSPVDTFDGTVAAQKALSAIHRTGHVYGAGHVIDVLMGKPTTKALERGHERLSVFGVGKELDQRGWNSVIRQLVAAGWIVVDHANHGALTFGEEARPLLRGEIPIRFRKDREMKAEAVRERRPAEDVPPEDGALFEELRGERLRASRTQRIAPYMVFTDVTLREMARRRPRDLREMGSIPGIGQSKLDRYGETFLEIVSRHPREAAAVP